jgi:mannose-6-phosphate isomerase
MVDPLHTIQYPLRMSGALDPKPWGGSRLALFGKQLPDEPIGESLESGSESRVTNGPLAGRTLVDLVRSNARSLLGSRGDTASGSFRDFPLLVKLIDAHENLSVQVHPDDELAPAGKRGKTEAWLILHAQPGARIVAGVDGPLDPDRIEDHIVSVPVHSGDVFFIPAGTVHAIGAGVLLYEVQQASDVTYRLYDWGRQREMHVHEGTRASRVDQRAARITPLRLDEQREMLTACSFFALERWSIRDRFLLRSTPEVFRVLTVVDGDLWVSDVAAARGDTLVIPADLPECTIRGDGTVLVTYIPDVAADVVSPLAAAGHERATIDSIGINW